MHDRVARLAPRLRRRQIVAQMPRSDQGLAVLPASRGGAGGPRGDTDARRGGLVLDAVLQAPRRTIGLPPRRLRVGGLPEPTSPRHSAAEALRGRRRFADPANHGWRTTMSGSSTASVTPLSAAGVDRRHGAARRRCCASARGTIARAASGAQVGARVRACGSGRCAAHRRVRRRTRPRSRPSLDVPCDVGREWAPPAPPLASSLRSAATRSAPWRRQRFRHRRADHRPACPAEDTAAQPDDVCRLAPGRMRPISGMRRHAAARP